MQLTTEEIAHLARRAGVPFGHHAFIIVQTSGAFSIAERAFLCTAESREQVKADAEGHAAKRKVSYPSSDFMALEVGAPAPDAAMIARLADLLDEAITAHIYDADNGDVIPTDCRYSAAVRDARATVGSLPGEPAA